MIPIKILIRIKIINNNSYQIEIKHKGSVAIVCEITTDPLKLWKKFLKIEKDILLMEILQNNKKNITNNMDDINDEKI
jgi:hypothetical protein